MAVEKIYMVGYSAIGNSNNTGICDHYIEGKGMVAGMTVPKVWNYRVCATNADEARYIAWPMFLKDFYSDTPLGKVDSSKWLKCDDYSTSFTCVYAYVDKKASSGTVGKTADGDSRNEILAEKSRRKRTRRNRRAGKKTYRKNSVKSSRTINGQTPDTTCHTSTMETQDTE